MSAGLSRPNFANHPLVPINWVPPQRKDFDRAIG